MVLAGYLIIGLVGCRASWFVLICASRAAQGPERRALRPARTVEVVKKCYRGDRGNDSRQFIGFVLLTIALTSVSARNRRACRNSSGRARRAFRGGGRQAVRDRASRGAAVAEMSDPEGGDVPAMPLAPDVSRKKREGSNVSGAPHPSGRGPIRALAASPAASARLHFFRNRSASRAIRGTNIGRNRRLS